MDEILDLPVLRELRKRRPDLFAGGFGGGGIPGAEELDRAVAESKGPPEPPPPPPSSFSERFRGILGRGPLAFASNIGGPLAGGIIGTVLGGPGFGTAIGAGLGGALGEAGAESLEGESLNPTEIGISGALGAIPAGPFARMAGGLPAFSKLAEGVAPAIVPLGRRLGLSALEGATQGALGATARPAVMEGRLPTPREVLAGSAGGAVLGAPFGLLTGRIAEAAPGTAAEDLAKASRYEKAADPMLLRGLGKLVQEGSVTEEQATRVAERATAQKLGEPEPQAPPPEIPPAAPPPAPPSEYERARQARFEAGLASTPEPVAAAAAPLTPEAVIPTPAAGEPTPVAAAAAPPAEVAPPAPIPAPVPVAAEAPLPAGTTVAEPGAAPAPPVARHPMADRLRIKPAPDQIAALFEQKAASGELLTKGDLLAAGLITKKQKRDQPMGALVDALGGTHLKPRMVASKSSRGFTISPGVPGEATPLVPVPVSAEPVVSGGPVTPSSEPGVPPPAAAVPAPAPAGRGELAGIKRVEPTPGMRAAAQGLQAELTGEPAPAPPRAGRGKTGVSAQQIDETLAHPEHGPAHVAVLQQIAGERPIESLTQADIKAHLPAEEAAPTRAVLYRLLGGMKKAAREKVAVEGLTPEEAARTAAGPPPKPAPDRVLSIGRGAHGPVRVIFPDRNHADLYSAVGRSRRQISGEGVGRIPAAWNDLADRFGVDRAKIGEMAVQYRVQINEAVKGIPKGETITAPPAAGVQPQAAVAGSLTDQLVASRGPQWDTAIKAGTQMGDHRVVDLEGDASSFVKPLAGATSHTAAALGEALDAAALKAGDADGHFAGWAPSPQLHAVRLPEGAILENPLQAFHAAEAELAGSGRTGDDLREALAYKTAERLWENGTHEIAHAKARHDAATGDISFVDAYANVIHQLGPDSYVSIRRIRDAVLHDMDSMAGMLPAYRATIERSRGISAEPNVAAAAAGVPGPVAGPSEGGAPALEGGPGGAPGGAAGGALGREGPGGALPAGGEPPAAGERATAAAPEGGAAVPHAARTGPSDPAVARERRLRVAERAASGDTARAFARYSGAPDAAAAVGAIESAAARPGFGEKIPSPGKYDIGRNIQYLEGLTTEQRRQIAAAWRARNELHGKGPPMEWANIDSDLKNILHVNSPEDFAAWQARTGIKDPADFALLSTAVDTYGTKLDRARVALREAQIRGDDQATTSALKATASAGLARMGAIDTLIPDPGRGRRLQIFSRMVMEPLASGESVEDRFFGALKASGIGKGQRDALYSMLQDTMAKGPAADWGQFQRAFEQATRPGPFRKFLEFWKAGLLGIPTQFVNVGSNVLFRGLRDVEQATSVLANQLFGRVVGRHPERYTQEVSARILGQNNALGDALGMFAKDASDIVALRPTDLQRRLAQGSFQEGSLYQQGGAIGGRFGEFVRTPFKFLDAADNLFKHLARSGEYSAQAVRLAHDATYRSPGESVEHAIPRILQEIHSASQSPVTKPHLFEKYKEAIQAGRDAADADTFQTKLSPVMQKVVEALRAHPALDLLVPFFKTPYNILAEAAKRTPAGALWAINQWHKGTISNPVFVENMVKSGLGTVIMGAVADAALQGVITGSGPSDPKEADLLKLTGWQPYSIKAGNQYISYQRIDPFASLFGTAADLAEAWKRKDIDSASQLIQKTVDTVVNNFENKSFLTGVEALMKIMTKPEREGLSAIRQLQASLVPNIVGVVPVGHLTRALDPYYRETHALTLEPFMGQIPGLSTMLEPRRSPAGEPLERKGTPIERLVSPFTRSEEKTGPVAEAAGELARIKLDIGAPPPFFRIGSKAVYYTPEERQQIATAQERGLTALATTMRSGEYRAAPDDKDLAHPDRRTKKQIAEAVINRYRSGPTKRATQQATRRALQQERLSG